MYEAINFCDGAETPCIKDSSLTCLCVCGATCRRVAVALCLTSGHARFAVLFWGGSVQLACVLRPHGFWAIV